jgi:hypothetical protein
VLQSEKVEEVEPIDEAELIEGPAPGGIATAADDSPS